MTCPRWLRVVWPHSPAGPRIAYTAAQVAARRAAQMVLVVGCTAGAAAIGYQAAQHAPASWLGLPPTAQVSNRLTFKPIEYEGVQRVPEPASALVLGVGLVGLWWRRRA